MPADDQQPQLTPHDQAMIAKVDAAAAAAQANAGGQPPAEPAKPAAAQRPEGVPEKFWDAEKGAVNTEALLKSYTELESARSKPADEPPKGNEEPPKDAEKALADAKVDMQALSDEFSKDGKLSEASYAALEKAGFGKDVVDSYIAGQQAIVAQREAQGYELAGGKDKFDAMAQWALANLQEADRDAFNEAVSGTPAQMKQAIMGLRAQYEAANGTSPQLVSGSNGNGDSMGAYGSRQEMTAAMKDPRYRKDPAYRAEVERRVGLMTNF